VPNSEANWVAQAYRRYLDGKSTKIRKKKKDREFRSQDKSLKLMDELKHGSAFNALIISSALHLFISSLWPSCPLSLCG